MDEGFDPDDPQVVMAIDLVRWELSLLLTSPSDLSGLVDGNAGW
ncbi:hypothetical protein ACP6C3_30515 [Mycolicibacterium septicum]|uniref:Uncharacterized protein n=1 Tax=Mycolicibacterium septicum TaxID=98668 RepID=A0ABW9M390_9MYCO|nr:MULTISPECIES: hypothetical protein [Mycolicibacterium]